MRNIHYVLLATISVLMVAICIELASIDSENNTENEIKNTVKHENKPKIEEPKVINETPTIDTEQPEFDYYDIPLDEDLQDHIFLECEFYDVDPALIISVIKKESEFRDWVIGDNGRSYGLMQIQERWHEERMDRLEVTDLLNPYQNVTVGIDYFAELLDKEKGVEWALMAYNGGISYANKLRAKGIVSNYVKTVLGYSEELRRK